MGMSGEKRFISCLESPDLNFDKHLGHAFWTRFDNS